jgi:hypothetical protein
MDWQGNPIEAYLDLGLDAFDAAPFGTALPVSAVILLERRDADPDALELALATKGDVALAVMRQSRAPALEAKGHAVAATLVAGSATCLRLAYGSTASAADLLSERFGIG